MKNEEIINVQLLTTIMTPDEVKKARVQSEIYQCGLSFHRLVSVLPDQGCAYENQVLTADWRNNQWEVMHPAT